MRVKPVNLNLFTIAFPMTAIVSILHRISGVLLFLLIPFALGVLQNTLVVPAIFCQVSKSSDTSIITKILIWLAVSALMYHLFAGIRHLLMDAGFMEDKKIARITAFVVLKLSFIVSVIVGIFLIC